MNLAEGVGVGFGCPLLPEVFWISATAEPKYNVKTVLAQAALGHSV